MALSTVALPSSSLSTSSGRHAPRISNRAVAARVVTPGVGASQRAVSPFRSSSFLHGTPLSSKVPVARLSTRTHAAVGVQANLVSRFARVLRSYAFFYSDAAVKEVEDPRKMLDQVVNEMQDDLLKMRQASAQVFAAQQMMQARYTQSQNAADDWYRRAELALKLGDENLAREALKRRKTFQTAADNMKGQLDQHTKAADMLMRNIRLLDAKVAEAQSKKETLKARAASAQAAKMLNEQLTTTLSGLRSRSDSSLAAFATMEEKVLAMEAEVEATGQLFGGDPLESQFALLEGGGGVEDDLVALKADMLAAPADQRRPAIAGPAGNGYLNIPVQSF